MHNKTIIPTHPNNCIRFNRLARVLNVSYKELALELGITLKRPSVLIHLPFTTLCYKNNSE